MAKRKTRKKKLPVGRGKKLHKKLRRKPVKKRVIRRIKKPVSKSVVKSKRVRLPRVWREKFPDLTQRQKKVIKGLLTEAKIKGVKEADVKIRKKGFKQSVKLSKSPGGIQIKYYTRTGALNDYQDPYHAFEFKFFKGGKQYGAKIGPHDTFWKGFKFRDFLRKVLPSYNIRDIFMEKAEFTHGFSWYGTVKWHPWQDKLEAVLGRALGTLFRGRKDLVNIVVSIKSDMTQTTMAEVEIHKSWTLSDVRQAVYRELVFKILQNIRAVGGNTSDDRLKKRPPGKTRMGGHPGLNFSSLGFPMPKFYTLGIYARGKGDFKIEYGEDWRGRKIQVNPGKKRR